MMKIYVMYMVLNNAKLRHVAAGPQPQMKSWKNTRKHNMPKSFKPFCISYGTVKICALTVICFMGGGEDPSPRAIHFSTETLATAHAALQKHLPYLASLVFCEFFF